MRIRVIAVGHPYGGDDAVGFAVTGDLKSRGVPPGVEIIEISDPTQIPHLISGIDRVIVVDAVIGEGKAGEVQILTPEELEAGKIRPVSSHGIGVIDSLRMGRLLLPEGESPEMTILGIRIPEARRFTEGLSPEVAAAVSEAVTRVVSLLWDRRRWSIEILGTVQGVGFRPFVYRLAAAQGLTGFVRNRSDGVFIEVQGPSDKIEAFMTTLNHPPPLARIESCQRREIPVNEDETAFVILESARKGSPLPVIPPDAAICADCLREIRDPADRRYRYPFANCTHCGPRFSIVKGIPYDRPNTTMKGFPLCPDCRREYEAPEDRRFDAQPIACPACGPRLEGYDPDGKLLAIGDAALQIAVDHLLSGKIVALKGLGGFQLLTDGTNEEAVARLRVRKRREEKPFALMFHSLEDLPRVADPTEAETALLQSPEAPIVLVRKSPPSHSGFDRPVLPSPFILSLSKDERDPEPVRGSKGERGLFLHPDKETGRTIAPGVSPDNPYLGVLLPYTPLHHLLMERVGKPIVCTSGNLRDEPICIDNDEAMTRLSGIADFFLAHNRPVARPVDDPVVRVVNGNPLMIRRARGYAPAPILLSKPLPPLLAVGAHLKSTVAISLGNRAILSQHIGDLETAETLDAFHWIIDDLLRFYQVSPQRIVCDLHPEYPSTRFAEGFAADRGIPLIRVQHHHAHVAACMAEHHLEDEVLGVAWDGTGYGTDGTLWGGEFLICDGLRFRRLAHLRPFRLPGGEAAIREPRRTAFGLLLEAGLPLEDSVLSFSDEERNILERMIHQEVNAPVSTGMGRLFDGVAALLGLKRKNAFEGQAAMALEHLTVGEDDPLAVKTESGGYPIPLREGEPWTADWSPLLQAIIEDRDRGVPPARIAVLFHHTLVELIVTVARKAAIPRVVLSGGCFQNALLTAIVLRRLKEEGFQAYIPRQIPPNDGGISLGQTWVGGRTS